MGYKRYSDAFVGEALVKLAINRYDYDKTAEQLGVSARTLFRWEKDVTKKGIPELLERTIERMLMVIPDKWSGNEWAIALGILMDKWLLIQGKPTSKTEQIVRRFGELSEDEFDNVLAEADRILQEAASRGDHPGAGG